jgi:alpha-galactosidase/6-phospho-beta-glucosidase family protein
MSDYSKGKIYKIVNNLNDECYVGSTTLTINMRFNKHKSDYNVWLTDQSKGKCSCFDLFEKYGLDNWKIVLIENFPCESRDKLDEREEFWRCNLNSCNSNRSFRSHEDIKKDSHEYYEKNKEYFNEYREKNQEYIKQYAKNYHEKNRESINEKKREKITCECGQIYNRGNLSAHNKSQFHLNYINNIQVS